MTAVTISDPLINDTIQRLTYKFARSIGVTGARMDDTLQRLLYRIAIFLGVDARMDDMEQRLLWKIAVHLEASPGCCVGFGDNTQKILYRIAVKVGAKEPQANDTAQRLMWKIATVFSSPSPPPPLPKISWTPASYVARWDEGSGLKPGDLATFLATANFTAVTRLVINDGSITDIQGLSDLPNLQTLTLTDSQMTSIDLSGNPSLVQVLANSTALLSLDLSNHLSLLSIICDNSQLLSLDLHGCTALQFVHAQQSELGTVNIHNCPSIVELWIYDNPQTLTNPPINVIF